MGKITAQLSENMKWFAMYQYNRGIEVPEMWSVTKTHSPLETQQIYDDSSHTVSSVLTYILNQNTFMDARFGYVRRLMALGFSNEWEGPADRAFHTDRTTLEEWGMPDGWNDYYRTNYNVSLVLTKFLDGFLDSDHEFKAGLEYMYGTADRQSVRPNPYFYYWNKGEPWYYSDVEAYRGRFRVYAGATGTTLRPRKAGMRRMSFFIQDTAKIGERLTLNLVIRYDNSVGFVPAKTLNGWDDVWEDGLVNILLPEIFLSAGESLQSPEIDDAMTYNFFSPRIGFTYYLFGSGETLLKGS